MSKQEHKLKREKLWKRKKSLFKKANELATLCDADVAVIICKNGQYDTYRSMTRETWPPPMEKIVSYYPCINIHCSDNLTYDLADVISITQKPLSSQLQRYQA